MNRMAGIISDGETACRQENDSKGCISDLLAESGSQDVDWSTLRPAAENVIKFERQHFDNVVKITIKARITQIGKDNHIVQNSIKYQKSLMNNNINIDSEQKNIKDDPLESTDVESEDEIKRRTQVDHHKQRQSLVESKDENSSVVHKPNGRKQRKKTRCPKRQLAVNPESIQLPDPSKSYNEFCKISDEVMMAVQVFRDNGQWGIFRDTVQRMSRKYTTSQEAKIIILLEKSRAACFQNELEGSEKMIKKAIRKVQNTENSSSLIARAYYYLSGVKRRMDNCLEAAKNCVDLAEQNIHGKHLTRDNIFAYYERGSVLMDICTSALKGRHNLESLKEEAITCLKKCIDISEEFERNTKSKRYNNNKHHFAYIKLAMSLLDCHSNAARNKEITAVDIQEAKSYLDNLINCYRDTMTLRVWLRYYLAMSDLYWCLQDLDKAESLAEHAYSMATKYGFNTEIKPAMKRLEEIRAKIQGMQGRCTQLLQTKSEVLNNVQYAAQLSDSCCYCDVSSSSELDFSSSLSFL